MNGLIKSASGRTETGGRDHTDGAGNHRCLIRKNIPKHILRHHNVKLRRVLDDLHSTVVNQHIAQLNIGIFFGKSVHYLLPEAAGIQYIALFNGAELPPSFSCGFKADSANTLDFFLVVCKNIDSSGLAVNILSLMLTEIDSADQFSNNNEINAFIYN